MTHDAFGISDAARRCSEQINLHVLAKATGKFAAIRLSDGGSDGIAYDTRADAVRHQLHSTQCAYVQIPLLGMPESEAEAYLAFHRKVYDQGYRPKQDTPDPMVPTRRESFRGHRWTR